MKVKYLISMLAATIQATLLITCAVVLPPSDQVPIKLKRSPLELGYVSFTDTDGFSKRPSEFPAILKHAGASKLAKISVPKQGERKSVHAHVLHEWVPGHVDHHSFIPGHVHHMLIPAHGILVTGTVHVLVPETHKLEIYEPYRSHYGGFGVGLDFGGHGAGHGFHVLF